VNPEHLVAKFSHDFLIFRSARSMAATHAAASWASSRAYGGMIMIAQLLEGLRTRDVQ
jgi:hypothetical protein